MSNAGGGLIQSILGQISARLDRLEVRIDGIAEDLTEVRERLSGLEKHLEARLSAGAEQFASHNGRLKALEKVARLAESDCEVRREVMSLSERRWRLIGVICGIVGVVATWVGLAAKAFGLW